MPTWMWVLGAGVILPLASYAALLCWQLRQQQQRQWQTQQARREHLITSIQLIAKACQQKQCEPAEGALRLINLLRALPEADMQAQRLQYPNLHQLYDKVAEQPILAERKALKRNERMKLDMEREHWEDQFGPKLDPELLELAQIQ